MNEKELIEKWDNIIISMKLDAENYEGEKNKSDFVKRIIKESFKAGQDNKKNLIICQDNAHNMEWVCSICGLVEDSKHSHKTCIIKFDERVQKAQQDTVKIIDNTFNNWHIKFLNDFEPKTESKEIINWWCNIQDRIEELKLKLVLKNEF